MPKRRTGRNLDSKRFLDWLDMAGDDIRSAGHLANDPVCYNAAAFHCQQAIEKSLKAYILFKKGILVDGHNLTWLCKKSMECDKSFVKWLDGCTALNHCYIETRYPADIPHDISRGILDEHYTLARGIYSYVFDEFYN